MVALVRGPERASWLAKDAENLIVTSLFIDFFMVINTSDTSDSE